MNLTILNLILNGILKLKFDHISSYFNYGTQFSTFYIVMRKKFTNNKKATTICI